VGVWWAAFGEWLATVVARIAADVLTRYIERRDQAELARLRRDRELDRLAIRALEYKARMAGRDLTLRVRAGGGVIVLPGDDPRARGPAARDPMRPCDP
jgi:hypothetical protein